MNEAVDTIDQTDNKDRAEIVRATLRLSLAYWALFFVADSVLGLFINVDPIDSAPNKLVPFGAGALMTYIMSLLLFRMRRLSFARKALLGLLMTVVAAPLFTAIDFITYWICVYPAPVKFNPLYTGYTLIEGASILFGWSCLFIALLYHFEVRERERKLAAIREEALTAQMQALRYQVNPHFLFNTLNSIAGLIEEGAATRAGRMVLSLSTLMRSTLSLDPMHDVALADELALQEEYLGDRARAFLGSHDLYHRHARGAACRAGAQPDSAAVGRERDQARSEHYQWSGRDRSKGPAASRSPAYHGGERHAHERQWKKSLTRYGCGAAQRCRAPARPIPGDSHFSSGRVAPAAIARSSTYREARVKGLTVLLVDDEPLARRRLTRLLSRMDWIGRIEEAADVSEACRKAARHETGCVASRHPDAGWQRVRRAGAVGTRAPYRRFRDGLRPSRVARFRVPRHRLRDQAHRAGPIRPGHGTGESRDELASSARAHRRTAETVASLKRALSAAIRRAVSSG